MLDIGICGTDKEICSFEHGTPPPEYGTPPPEYGTPPPEYGTPPPGDDYLVIGHESVAEIVEVGSAVEHLKVGDLVIPSVRRPCPDPRCLACRSGHQDYCYTGDFTELGTGIPAASNTHEVAQSVVPSAGVVYVDNDQAARTLDFTEPVALTMIAVLHLIPDEQNPWALVSEYLQALPSGSYLVISHPASDVDSGSSEQAAQRYNERVASRMRRRSRREMARFFDGLDLVEPGIVQLHHWRAAMTGLTAPSSGYVGVGRKP